jgi:CRP-like cAMP-binding protein
MNEPSLDRTSQAFFTHYPMKQLAPGHVLIQAGDEPSGVFYLESGLVRQFTTTKDGVERTLNLYKPGSFFPMSWALNHTPNRYTFETVLDSQIRIAPVPAVVDFLKSNPDTMFDLLQRIFKALDGLLLNIEQQTTGNAYQILIATILILARRFGRQSASGTQIQLVLTQSRLAAHAGLSRETVSRTLQRCKAKGLLMFNTQKLVIPHLAALEAELEA